MYYGYQESRLHFIRPCVHQITHLASETIRKGPLICYAQWTMERTIGNLGQEIQQPSHLFANLAQEGVRRCRVNGLLAAIPELGCPPQGIPESAVDLGIGYVLLPKEDRHFITPPDDESQALHGFLGSDSGSIKRWARLQLPNHQIARSHLYETGLQNPCHLRVSRNVVVSFFFHLTRASLFICLVHVS